jgi:hypothetical protein
MSARVATSVAAVAAAAVAAVAATAIAATPLLFCSSNSPSPPQSSS